MRLINATTLMIEEFLNETQIPPFAILSHTWGEEECTFQQMQDPLGSQVSRRKGYLKIQLCCKQALTDGFQWVWIDTCCIDKTSTAELSEAINSMFRWYREAHVCYAYLTDVVEADQLDGSRWFTRGWTLQELVAPRTVWFYTVDWRYMGSKLELQERIQQITGIEAEVLTTGALETFSIARRMSWAAKRQTTRIEDQAYSLMGIFDVNMPLLYGEGKKAFTRLQEAILKVSDDQSLFAWGLPAEVKTMQQFVEDFRSQTTPSMRGLFAESPTEFTHSDLIHVLEDEQSALPPIVSSNGVRIELQLKKCPNTAVQFAIIYCTLRDRYHHYIGVPIKPWGKRWVARCGELVTVAVTDLVAANSRTPFCNPSVLFIKSPTHMLPELKVRNTIKLIEVPSRYSSHYSLDEVHCAEHASYLQKDHTLTVFENQNMLHAAFFYIPQVSSVLNLFSLDRVGWHTNLRDSIMRTMIESHQKDAHSFINKGSYYEKHRWAMAYMPFAILVGGNWKDPWVKIMVILSEENPQRDLRALLDIDKNFVPCCNTKSYLLSLLNQGVATDLHSGNKSPHVRQITMLSNYSCGSDSQVSAQSGVDAHVQLVTSSLAECSLALFVEIEDFGDRKAEKQRQRPGWWALLDHIKPEDETQ